LLSWLAMAFADARTVEELALALDGKEAGEEREAFELLLDDEFQEAYPPDLRERLLARAENANWGCDLLRCSSCDLVILGRYRPDGGFCRECSEPLVARPLTLSFASGGSEPEPIPEPTWLEAPFEVATQRGSSALQIEEGPDFLDLRAAEQQRVDERVEAAAFLGGSAVGAALHLVFSEGDKEPIPLGPGTYVLGTARRNDVVLRARGVGFKHARMRVRADGASIEDLGVSEGVRVNDDRLETRGQVELSLGDVIALGALTFTLEGAFSVAAVEPEPEPTPAEAAAALARLEADRELERTSDLAEAAAARARAMAETAEAAEALEAAAEAEAARVAAEAAAAQAAAAEVALAEAAAAAEAAVLAAEAAAAALVPLELREESGKRKGRTHAIQPGGHLSIGTARSCDVVLRQRGVGYRHAVLHYHAEGGCDLEDLGASGGSWVGERQVVSKGRLAVPAEGRFRCGQALLRLVGDPAPTRPEPAPQRDESRSPWEAPTAAQVAAARHTDPTTILAALPERLLDLVATAAQAVPLAELLDSQPRGDRPLTRRDAEDFVFLARSVLDSRWLPEPAFDWVRWDPDQQQFLARVALPDGGTIILRPWELLARFPDPSIAAGPRRVTRALDRLVAHESERMLPSESEELAGGFWRCRYESATDGLLNGRFDSIVATSNGHVLGAELQPRFLIDPIVRARGEDPLEEARARLRERTSWRPGPKSVGAPAPHVPHGGRYGRTRPKPERPKARVRRDR
jgi:pSer/pThr/pTyr-binding forkhead associated (FHA) protein